MATQNRIDKHKIPFYGNKADMHMLDKDTLDFLVETCNAIRNMQVEGADFKMSKTNAVLKIKRQDNAVDVRERQGAASVKPLVNEDGTPVLNEDGTQAHEIEPPPYNSPWEYLPTTPQELIDGRYEPDGAGGYQPIPQDKNLDGTTWDPNVPGATLLQAQISRPAMTTSRLAYSDNRYFARSFGKERIRFFKNAEVTGEITVEGDAFDDNPVFALSEYDGDGSPVVEDVGTWTKKDVTAIADIDDFFRGVMKTRFDSLTLVTSLKKIGLTSAEGGGGVENVIAVAWSDFSYGGSDRPVQYLIRLTDGLANVSVAFSGTINGTSQSGIFQISNNAINSAFGYTPATQLSVVNFSVASVFGSPFWPSENNFLAELADGEATIEEGTMPVALPPGGNYGLNYTEYKFTLSNNVKLKKLEYEILRTSSTNAFVAIFDNAVIQTGTGTAQTYTGVAYDTPIATQGHVFKTLFTIGGSALVNLTFTVLNKLQVPVKIDLIVAFTADGVVVVSDPTIQGNLSPASLQTVKDTYGLNVGDDLNFDESAPLLEEGVTNATKGTILTTDEKQHSFTLINETQVSEIIKLLRSSAAIDATDTINVGKYERLFVSKNMQTCYRGAQYVIHDTADVEQNRIAIEMNDPDSDYVHNDPSTSTIKNAMPHLVAGFIRFVRPSAGPGSTSAAVQFETVIRKLQSHTVYQDGTTKTVNENFARDGATAFHTTLSTIEFGPGGVTDFILIPDDRPDTAVFIERMKLVGTIEAPEPDPEP